MASAYLSQTLSTPTNNKKFTFSFWLKRGDLGREQHIINGTASSQFYINSSDLLYFYDQTAGATYRTTQVFRDTNAWYHIVIGVDTTLATASNRVRIYVNGSEVTDFGIETDPTQNNSSAWNTAIAYYIGRYNPSPSGYYLDGSLTHFHFIDGIQYAASDFGETDSTTGIWKPKTAPSVTYGNNGFFLKFENSSAFGTDSSGNSNTFTVNGTITQTLDTPSNVFATLNPLDRSNGTTAVVSNGNLTLAHSGGANGSHTILRSTLAVSKGKYYCEYKQTVNGGVNRFGIIDIAQSDYPTESNPYIGTFSGGYAYLSDGNKENNTTQTAYGNTYTSGDIIGVAFDADNGVIWFSKNGTWQNSATIAEIEAGTTTNAAFTGIDTSKSYAFASSPYNNQAGTHNFGNGYFGTTAVSSAQNPDDGIGIFEHSVPTGYKALCTKSLNSQEYD